MPVQNYTPEMVSTREVSTNVAKSQDFDFLSEMQKSQTRDYSFITFNGYRTALGKNEWGTKIFFDSMLAIKMLQKCPKEYEVSGQRTISTYCPARWGNENYRKAFAYDNDTNTFGFNANQLHLLDDEFYRKLGEKAAQLEKIYKAERDAKSQANAAKAKAKRDLTKLMEE